jgi:NADH dehydrogenase
MSIRNRPRVVIVGAGFGGLVAARTLARWAGEVTLIDRNNYHTFLPLLYQVAAAELEATDIAYPVRSIARKLTNVRFIMAEVTGIRHAERVVETNGSEVPFDYLLLATGSVPHFFGVEGAEQYAFPLYELEQGVALRTQILRCFERAVREPEVEKRQQMLTFAIVGGGPTGVEYAGALAELIQGPLQKDYPSLDFAEVRLVLLEALDGLLSFLPEKLGTYTQSRLERMGVEVRLEAMVSRITAQSVHLKDGTAIPTETVVWTAGVRADSRLQKWGLPLARGGRVAIEPTLQVKEHPQIYAIGDLSYLEEDGRPLPMVAPVAMQQGKVAVQNIVRQSEGQELETFRYRDQGTMVTIGRNTGVARIGRRGFSGFFAWAAWLVVHLFKLIGFRNRLAVLLNWSWDYFFFERVARLIVPCSPEDSGEEASDLPSTTL